jgi:purine-binding chemotaxis protein CheW
LLCCAPVACGHWTAERVEQESTSIRSEALAVAGTGAAPEEAGAEGGIQRWVVFFLEGSRYALALEVVERIVRATQVTPLPTTLPVLLGIVDVQGRVLPVLSLRRRFGLPERPIDPKDHFVMVLSAGRTVVLVVDDVAGVVESSEGELIDAARIAPQLEYVRGVIRMSDGLVAIQDLDAFLSSEERCALEEAMRPGESG